MNTLRSRSALVAALSCSLVSAPPLAAQTEATDAHRGLHATLSRLDALFGSGDLDGYLAAFQPDNPWAHAARQRRLHCLLTAEQRPTRVSTIPDVPQQIGDRTVVRVHQQFRLVDGSEEITWSEDTVLALKEVTHETFVATLEVPSAGAGKRPADTPYVCTACNFGIGGAPGWLCVPMAADQSYSLEAVGFWLVGTDVVCEISVNVDDAAPTAKRVAQLLADTMRADATSSVVSPIDEWTPPTHAGALPPNCTGARVEITSPDELAAHGSARAVFHVLTFGPLQHILLARGSKVAMQRHAEALQRLLATYRLLQTDRDTSLAGLTPLRHHAGGALEGTTYRNEKFELRCEGPAGWTAQQRCGGAAFRVQWANARGSTLEMVGHRRPPGVAKWTPDKAAAFVDYLMETAQLAPCPDAPPFAWRNEESFRGMVCCIACAKPKGETSSKRRALHLVVRDDVLIVFDARVVDATDEAAVTTAMRSLTFD